MRLLLAVTLLWNQKALNCVFIVHWFWTSLVGSCLKWFMKLFKNWKRIPINFIFKVRNSKIISFVRKHIFSTYYIEIQNKQDLQIIHEKGFNTFKWKTWSKYSEYTAWVLSYLYRMDKGLIYQRKLQLVLNLWLPAITAGSTKALTAWEFLF